MKTVLGLGTNVGNREQQLRVAVVALGVLLSDIRYSPVYESSALLPEGAPDSWDTPFLNMAVCGETDLTPQALLEGVKAIEVKMGRTPRGHWGPREIDIDILSYGEEAFSAPGLFIPHAQLLVRDFALVPLAYLTPDWVHPAAKKTARALADAMISTLLKKDIYVP